MAPSLCWLLAAFLLPRVWKLLSRLLSEKQKHESETIQKPELSEIEGGVWERLSVFEHLEKGLRENPDGPAVISMLQPANCLDYLLTTTIQKTEVQIPDQNGLWERQKEYLNQMYNGEGQKQRGNGDDGAQQQNLVLWNHQNDLRYSNGKPRENGYTSPSPAPTTCLTLTFLQLHQAALRLAAGLIANGAQPNTTMVMLIPNSGEYTILLWLCVLLRITYVSLDPASLNIAGFTALKQTLQMLKPQLVVTPDALSGQAIDVAVRELGLPQPIRLFLSPRSAGSQASGWTSLAELAATAAKLPPLDESAIVEAARRDRPDRVHSIMFTSGTSGRPKGCPLRVSAMSHVLHSQAWLLGDKGEALRALQQPHNSRAIAPAQTLQTWRAGGAVVLTGDEFSAPDALKAVRRFGVTFLVLTPPMVHEMAAELARPRRQGSPLDVTSVRRIQVGGDAITKGLMVRCAALFPAAQVCVNHGMTEGPGVFVWPFLATRTSAIPFFGELCPVGRVAPGARVRIWDAARRRPARRGQLGQLHVAAPSIVRNYWGREADHAFYGDEKGRWFNTGDMGTMTADGLVFIMGREKDMINRAGVGTMPAAIESTIGAFTNSQTIVVPVPHHVLGAEPFAVVSSYNGKTETDIRACVTSTLGKDYALGGVASLKQLGLVEFPLNQTHKIIKSEVQQAVLKYMSTK